MTPRHTSWTPPMKQTMQMVEAQPATALPRTACTMAQMTPMKLMRLTAMPAPVMRRMGLFDRLVMPSKMCIRDRRRYCGDSAGEVYAG